MSMSGRVPRGPYAGSGGPEFTRPSREFNPGDASRIVNSQKKAKKAGKVIKDGPVAKVDWESLEKEEYLQGQHTFDDHNASVAQGYLGKALQQAEQEEKWSRARKIRKQLNLAVEARLAVRSSWCPTCQNYLHNCQCEWDSESKVEVDSLTVRVVHQILREIDQERKSDQEEWEQHKREADKTRRAERRIEYRAEKKARRQMK